MAAVEYFDRIRDCWRPLASAGTIIPFCTPIVRCPSALVVGTNRSWFDPDQSVAEKIAADFAERIPQCNTFTDHNHKFAVQLRKVARLAGVEVTEDWVGTNRCAVQTGPSGLDGLRKLPEFADCQRRMDELLMEFISWLQMSCRLKIFSRVCLLGNQPSALRAESCAIDSQVERF